MLPLCVCSSQGKKLPANISEDAEEGEVSDEDSADEIDEDCKLLNGDVSRGAAGPGVVQGAASRALAGQGWWGCPPPAPPQAPFSAHS